MAKILLVEDDDEARSLIKKMLSTSGHEIIEACDGEEGIRRVREDGLDLAIVDIILPEKSGLNVIYTIKKEHPDVKILAISGGGKFISKDFLDPAQRIGADRILPKPFSEEKLMEIIDALLI